MFLESLNSEISLWWFACCEIHLTQLKVMHTAQNYKQKCEANFIYFPVKTFSLMDYCRFEKSAHETTGQRMAYRCFYLWRQSWTVCPKSAQGWGIEEWNKARRLWIKTQKQGEKILLLQQGIKVASFKTLHGFKMLWPHSNKYWPAQAVDFATYTKEMKKKPSLPPFRRPLLSIHHVNSSSVSLGKAGPYNYG